MDIKYKEDWRIWGQPASPMLLSMTLNSGMINLKAYLGIQLWDTIISFKNNRGEWFYRTKELNCLGQKMIDYLMVDSYLDRFMIDYQEAKDILLKKIQILENMDYLYLKSEELVSVFNNLYGKYIEWYKFGWFCEPIQFKMQEIVASEYVEVNQGENKFDVQGFFIAKKESFIIDILDDMKSCSEMFEVAMNALDLQGLKNNLSVESVVMELLKSNNDTVMLFREKINAHISMYYWKNNNYSGAKEININTIVAELIAASDDEIKGSYSYYKDKVDGMRQARVEMKKQRDEMMKGLDVYMLRLCEIGARIGGDLMDERKKIVMMSNHHFDRLLKRISLNAGGEENDCHYLLPQELNKYLYDAERYKERIVERKKNMLVYWDDISVVGELCISSSDDVLEAVSMQEPIIVEGDMVEVFIKDINKKLNIYEGNSDVDEPLKGDVIYDGDLKEYIIEGIVRVIDDPLYDEISEGEILVASSTTPDFMNVIAKSSMIITDWGGYMSHAAIVARELKKPCIVGTIYATKRLNTGDIVVVDLKKGIIKKK